MNSLAISFDDVAGAQKRIAGVAHRTPVLTSTTANEKVGAQLFFKCENLQRMGAFKFRGAFNAISQFTTQQRANGVVAFSSGNHAQAIALSARLLDVKAVIVMPTDAPAVKVAATRGYGGEVIFYDRYTEDREAIGQRLASDSGCLGRPVGDCGHGVLLQPQPVFVQSHDGPNPFNQPERPCALQKPVSGAKSARSRKRKSEP